MENIKYLGSTQDTLHRDVKIYADDTLIYAVYRSGSSDEYISSEIISKIKSNPDAYLFTPYIEFIDVL